MKKVCSASELERLFRECNNPEEIVLTDSVYEYKIKRKKIQRDGI